jgi:acetyl esterase/lipase
MPFYALIVLTVLLGLVLLLGRGPASRPSTSARPGVECLEGRLTPSTYKVANIPYGTDSTQQVLDVYSDTTYTSAPIVVLVHGGGWVAGSKTTVESQYSDYFLDQGFVVVAPDYRLVTSNGSGGYLNQFPIPVDDVAAATAWIVANATTYHANPNEVIMLGTSAGAQIAAMIAFDPTGFGNWGLATPLHIAGFLGDSGAYDWSLVSQYVSHPQIPEYLGAYDGAPQWDPTEPITFATPGAPPSLIIDGTGDLFSNYNNSTAFVNALQAAGDRVTYQLYTGYGHVHFSSLFATDTAEQQVVTTYLQSIGL